MKAIIFTVLVPSKLDGKGICIHYQIDIHFRMAEQIKMLNNNLRQ